MNRNMRACAYMWRTYITSHSPRGKHTRIQHHPHLSPVAKISGWLHRWTPEIALQVTHQLLALRNCFKTAHMGMRCWFIRWYLMVYRTYIVYTFNLQFETEQYFPKTTSFTLTFPFYCVCVFRASRCSTGYSYEIKTTGDSVGGLLHGESRLGRWPPGKGVPD